MHPADIQATLKRKSITQKKIAKIARVSETAVSLVINKRMVSDKIMKVISDMIQKNPFEVFPDYYITKRKKAA